MHRFTSSSSFNSLVGSIDFSPRLLEDLPPDFIGLGGPGEGPITFLFAVRESIIDYNGLLLTVNKELNGVTASSVDLFGQKDGFNSLREFSKRSETRQVVTVTAVALEYIVRIDVVVESKVTFSIDFRRAPPVEISPILMNSMAHGVVQNARFLTEEVRVFPRLTLLDNLIIILRGKPCLVKREVFDLFLA